MTKNLFSVWQGVYSTFAESYDASRCIYTIHSWDINKPVHGIFGFVIILILEKHYVKLIK
jgi:hypothetical protein